MEQSRAEQRWSCRAYRSEPVDRELVVRMLELAQCAPSWCNTQPWQVLVTEGHATYRFRDALTEHVRSGLTEPAPDVPMPSGYAGVHLERRRQSGWQLYDAVGVRRGDRVASRAQALRNFELFGAPHVAIVTVDRDLGPYALVDAGVYVGHLLHAAHGLGLGAVAQAAVASYSPFVRSWFEIPEDRLVLLGVSFGWPDRNHPANGYRTTRAPLEDVVRFVSGGPDD